VLTRERVRNYSGILIAGALMAFALSMVARLRSPADFGAWLPDFLAHWTGGRALLEGLADQLYEPGVQQMVQDSAVGPGTDLSWFVSPPFVAVLYVPFGLMPYTMAAVMWTFGSGGLLLWGLRRLGTFGPRIWRSNKKLVLLATLASYPVFELFAAGQDSALMLAIWIGGAGLAIRSREAAAGLVFSLGLIKPQLVWVVPLLFVLQRRFTALAGFAAGGALVGIVSVAVAGVHGVRGWLALLVSPLYLEQISGAQDWKMGSVSALAKALATAGGVPFSSAVGYAAGLFIVAAFMAWTVRRSPDPQHLWAAALITSVAASPHLFLYDALLLTPAAIFALDRARVLARPWVATAFVLSWMMPSLHRLAEHSVWPMTLLSAPWFGVTVGALWLIVLRCP
jgi:hypothetical protein